MDSSLAPRAVDGAFKYYSENGEIALRHYEKAKSDGKVEGPAKWLVTITMPAAYAMRHILEGTMFTNARYQGFGFTVVVSPTNYPGMEISVHEMFAFDC